MSRREILIISALLIVLATLAGLGISHLQQQRSASQTAAEQLAEAQELAARISALRERPAQAGTEAMEVSDLTRLIEGAAEASGIDRDQLVRIWPSPPRRVGDSPYQEVATQVLLRHCTLEQLARFMLLVSEDVDAHRLRVASLRLSAPRSEAASGSRTPSGSRQSAAQDGPNRWSADVTLAYLIYAPPGDAPPRRAAMRQLEE